MSDTPPDRSEPFMWQFRVVTVCGERFLIYGSIVIRNVINWRLVKSLDQGVNRDQS